jgi:hypothetical protein
VTGWVQERPGVQDVQLAQIESGTQQLEKVANTVFMERGGENNHHGDKVPPPMSLEIGYIMLVVQRNHICGHTAMNIPRLVRSAQTSIAGAREY